MGCQSAEWGNFIKNKIMKPILLGSKNYKYGMSLDMNMDYTDIPLSFWSELFALFFHQKGIRMISQKNLNSFIEWVNKKKPKKHCFDYLTDT